MALRSVMRPSSRGRNTAAVIDPPPNAANAQALQDGAETFEVELLGRPYAQGPFRYQGKCYDALRKRFAAMPAVARDRVASVLEETGCLRYL